MTCEDAGNCHGCMKWCDVCGDVSAICSFRHCQAHHCATCDRHPVSCRDGECDDCEQREADRLAAEEQTKRIERAEQHLLWMNEHRHTNDSLAMQSAYIKALLAGYRRSKWDFVKERYQEQHPEEMARAMTVVASAATCVRTCEATR